MVNEVIDNDGSYRPTSWVNRIGDGDELVRLAFKFANEYAPSTELYYNDFNAWSPAKRDGIRPLVRMLKKEGIRIDGVGIQGHWGLDYPKNEYIEAAIDSFASLGVKVMITELDVDVLPVTKEGQVIGQVMRTHNGNLKNLKHFLILIVTDYRKRCKKISRSLCRTFRYFLRKRDKIDRVTFWGLHDGMSWKNDYPVPGEQIIRCFTTEIRTQTCL